MSGYGFGMLLIPMELGPLNPQVEHLALAAALFVVVHLAVGRFLPRVNRVLEERATILEGVTGGPTAELWHAAERVRGERDVLLSEARREAARVRQAAREEGAALIAESREEGLRERAELLATGQARVEAERAEAEAELRGCVSEVASELASRIVGEPIPVPAVNAGRFEGPDGGTGSAPPDGGSTGSGR
ncbi:ATP synthase F0 sector subunit b [Streptomyces formicae]|uniref:ATP synthase F0 sector subunit b n=2 Tax=Streptomyces formicae TaxID=1616117 RepID=A0A291QK92_9ACTN|nr:ATP synthase F0 sector subunit b [Streptomyces formicae]